VPGGAFIGGFAVPDGCWSRSGAVAVLVGVGFSTMRICSRSAASATAVELSVEKLGLPSAETDWRVLGAELSELAVCVAAAGG
jgi:hypothetical protein